MEPSFFSTFCCWSAAMSRNINLLGTVVCILCIMFLSMELIALFIISYLLGYCFYFKVDFLLFELHTTGGIFNRAKENFLRTHLIFYLRLIFSEVFIVQIENYAVA